MADNRDELLETYDPPAKREILSVADAFMTTAPLSVVHNSRLVLRDQFLRTFPTAASMDQFLKDGTMPAPLIALAKVMPAKGNPIENIAGELFDQQKNVLPDSPVRMSLSDPLTALSNLPLSGAATYPSMGQSILSDMGFPSVFSTFIETSASYLGGRRMEGHLFLTLPPNNPSWTPDTIQIAGERMATDAAYTQIVERTRVYAHDLPENMGAPKTRMGQREQLSCIGAIQMIKGLPAFDPITPVPIPHRPAFLDQMLYSGMTVAMAMVDLGYSRTLIKDFNEAVADGNTDSAARINLAHVHHTLRSMRRATLRDYGEAKGPSFLQ